ncbi:unnamed protein product [Caenorhabditis auriculariae]|uniref:Uncharacterized protein n=1 Tax=Caenorhabditis auriculariae TaxID=2777116 RepID=A0A8S1GZT8_9PELO|nr:unnamed protein product [Caenorhabditis auriculariae]
MTTPPQCVCIPQGSQCMNYDSRIQANSLEEAMASFPDLTIEQPVPEPTNQISAVCATKECQDCQNDLRKRLEQIGLLNATINSIITAGGANSTCSKYRFSRNDAGVYDKSKNHSDGDDSDDSDDDDDDDEPEYRRRNNKKEDKKRKKEHHRSRRQAVPVPDPALNVIGTRFTISCSTKGVTTDAVGTVSLCSSCWVWRRLPANYSPQYLNELICDDADNACLSGYAKCSVGERTVEVMRDDNGVKSPVVLTAGSFCECRILSGSTLENLVSGTGISGVLPPVTSTDPMP